MPWPSGFAQGTLGYMIDQIDMELMRNGTINSQIQAYIQDACTLYAKERFRFNETFTANFTTVVGQQNYKSIADPSNPSVSSVASFLHIDWVTITIPPAVFDLPRIQPEEILIMTQTGTQLGQPYCYAQMADTIMLYPIPSSGGPGQIQQLTGITAGAGYTNGVYANQPLTGGHGNSATANFTVVGGQVFNLQLVNPGTQYQVGDILGAPTILGPGSGFAVTVLALTSAPIGPYLITVAGQLLLPAPATTAETGNVWMTQAARMIRSRAKYDIACHLTRNTLMAQMMSPDEPARGSAPGATYEAYRALKVEGVAIAQRGQIRPMAF